MGREAKCSCTWAGKAALCTVLLESHELIVRGPIRRRVPVSLLTDITIRGELLIFAWSRRTYPSLSGQTLCRGGQKQ